MPRCDGFGKSELQLLHWPGLHRLHVRRAEIGALEQQRLGLRDRKRLRRAVTEGQRRTVPSFAVAVKASRARVVIRRKGRSHMISLDLHSSYTSSFFLLGREEASDLSYFLVGPGLPEPPLPRVFFGHLPGQLTT